MRYEIKYLININPKIKTIKKLVQYLTLYSTIFFQKMENAKKRKKYSSMKGVKL